MEFVALGLGSNRKWNGKEPLEILAIACEKLSPLFKKLDFSSVYRTKPMYVENQDDFYNMVACGYCNVGSPEELLSEIHRIEAELGRNRDEEIRNGPRSIDIDIEIFGEQTVKIVDSEDKMKNLEIPHPRIHERSFVLVPMLEVLKEYADVKDREVFMNDLKKIGSDGIEKFSRIGYGRTKDYDSSRN